ncbi:MAG TPA: hypothetical protein VGV57_07870 [Thermoleophilaceae bacterium]|nr:hypothetical protein [Thermoleophilaceae bacterium]
MTLTRRLESPPGLLDPLPMLSLALLARRLSAVGLSALRRDLALPLRLSLFRRAIGLSSFRRTLGARPPGREVEQADRLMVTDEATRSKGLAYVLIAHRRLERRPHALSQ